MTDSTLEEAARCPRCSEPGRFVGLSWVRKMPSHRQHQIRIYQCENGRCDWGETRERWTVQVNPDGSIPPAYTSLNQERAFPVAPRTKNTSQQERELRERLRRELP